MTKTEKVELVNTLKEKFESNSFFYVLDSGGMTVAEINGFRSLCHEKGFDYQVVKNTLVIKALDQLDTDYTPMYDKALKGFSGILFSQESGSGPAKLLKEFRKKGGGEKPMLKGASIESSFFFGEESLEGLSKLKSKEDLLAELLGLLQSPASNLVRALQSPGENLAGALKSGGSSLAGALKALADKKEKEG